VNIVTKSFEIQPPWRRPPTCYSCAPARKQALERASYAYASEMSWPRAGKHWLALMRWVASLSQATSARSAT
jgi:hypothetical protein